MSAVDVPIAALIAPFASVLVGAAIADVRKGIGPNRLVFPAIAASAATIGVLNLFGLGAQIVDGIIELGLLGGSLATLALWKPEGLGMGDAKLAALIGLVLGSLGLRYVEVAAFTAFLLGGVWAVTLMAFTSGGGQRKVLFAPFLAAGGLIACCLALIS